MTDTGPQYPNQQLRSVSLETYFAGTFSALARLEQLQEKYRDRFPHLYVPNATDGKPLAMQPFQLRSSNLSTGDALAIAINQATYFAFQYPGHAKFIATGVQVLRETLQLLGVSMLSRVTYRYENAIGLAAMPGGGLPLRKILGREYVDPWAGDDPVEAMEATWRGHWSRGNYEVGARTVDEQGLDILRLTIASTVTEAGVGELEAFANAAHDHANAKFERMISDGFRAFLQGSPSQ